MKIESSEERTGRMNRRQMLGTTTALVGGAVAGVAGNAFAQERPKAPPAATALRQNRSNLLTGGRAVRSRTRPCLPLGVSDV